MAIHLFMNISQFKDTFNTLAGLKKIKFKIPENRADQKAIFSITLMENQIMQKRQRIILFTSACILITMLLFPPFECRDSGTISNKGYGFILNPPENDSDRGIASVNSGLLFIQSMIVIIASYMFFLSFKSIKEKVEAEKKRHEFKIALMDRHSDPKKFADEYIEKYLMESLSKPPRSGNC